MKKLFCFRSDLTDIFRSKRLAFVGETPSGEPESTEKNATPTEKEDLKAEAQGALKDATDEMGNIEKKYNIPKNATDKRLDDAAKKSKMPDKVKDAYDTLRTATDALKEYLGLSDKARQQEEDTMELSRSAIQAVFSDLDRNANEIIGNLKNANQGDPLFVLENALQDETTQKELYEPVHKALTEVLLPSQIKKQEEDRKKAQEKAHEEHLDELATSTMNKLYNGSDFTEEEGKIVLDLFQGKDHMEGHDKQGAEYILDLSTDKKAVRVQIKESGKNIGANLKMAYKEPQVQALKPGNEGPYQFKTLTESEKVQKEQAENVTESGKQIAWLKTEKAPVGSMIILGISIRKDEDTNEQFDDIKVVKKAADGKLYQLTMEYPIVNGRDDTSRMKEIDVKPFDQEKANNNITAEFSPVKVEANKEMQAGEVKRQLNQIGAVLAGSIIFGSQSELYQNTRKQLADVIQKNQGLLADGWSYTWKVLDVTVRYNPADKMVAVSEGNRTPGQTPASGSLAFNDSFRIERNANV